MVIWVHQILNEMMKKSSCFALWSQFYCYFYDVFESLQTIQESKNLLQHTAIIHSALDEQHTTHNLYISRIYGMTNDRIHGIVNKQKTRQRKSSIACEMAWWNITHKSVLSVHLSLHFNCKTYTRVVVVVDRDQFQLKISNVPLKEPIFNFWSMKWQCDNLN